MTLESQIQRQYDQMARRYDRRWQSYLAQSLDTIQAWLDLDRQNQVLEVGCGTGELAARLLNQHPGLGFTGIDLSSQMLAVAQEKCNSYPQAQFLVANAAHLPFPEHQFDWIVSSSVFHYFPQPHHVLTEMQRVLKPGGQIVILDWCRDYLVCQIYDWVLPWIDPAYRQCYSVAEFEGLIHGAGLAIQALERYRTSWAWEFMVAQITVSNT